MWKIIIFFRTDSPGDLQISLLKPENNDSTGGDNQGLPKVVTDLINITKSSPNRETIKLSMTPAEDVRVGDSFEIKATLLASDGDMDQMFLVKVVDKEKKDNTHLTWDEFEGLMSFTMNHSQILHPYAEGDILEKMYINMDSSVLLSHKKKLKSQEQIELADKKYISSVYFHALKKTCSLRNT